MTTIELNNIQSGKVSAVAGQEGGQPRARGKDNGPTTLPHLEHLVHITRKVQRPMLLRILLESEHGQVLPAAQALTDDAKGSLPIPSRNALFALVAEMARETQACLEHAAERHKTQYFEMMGDRAIYTTAGWPAPRSCARPGTWPPRPGTP